MKLLKQSAADWCFYKNISSADDYYRDLKRIGYQAVEMVPPERWPAARMAGLKLLNLSGPGMERGLNRTQHHPELLAKIKELIATAGANQIPQIIVFSGNRQGQSDEMGIANCIKALAELASTARDAGVTLLLETLNSFEHKDYQCDSAAYAAAVVRQVNSPHVRMLYDIYHLHRMGEKVDNDIVDYIPLIGHLHIAGSLGRGFPGEDQAINYKAIVAKVMAAGYQGYWGQEFLPQAASLPELERALKLFDRYAAEV